MKWHKPKSCAGCTAYRESFQRYKLNSREEYCLFGMETEKIDGVLWKGRYEDIVVTIKPKGKCPKPKTREEYLEAYKLWEKGLIGSKYITKSAKK